MATLKLKLENGFFAGSNGVYLQSLTPTEVSGNGWDCRIHENGMIECICAREYADGVHSIRYAIQPNGFAKLTLRVPGQRDKVLKKGFVLRRGEKLSNGTLGLAGGHVDCRYAYFRNESLTAFMEKYGLTAISREDPNQVFELRHVDDGRGTCRCVLTTDGSSEYKGAELFERINGSYQSYEVTNASWAIVEKRQWEGDNKNYSRILYTLSNDIYSLDLPVK